MSPSEFGRYYVRHLPHVQPEGATFFITCRLAGSIPPPVRLALIQEAESEARRLDDVADKTERSNMAYLMHRKAFGRWDATLDAAVSGPTWLKDPRIANIVTDSLRFRDGKQHDLLAFCIMPNHIHVVLTPLSDNEGHYPSLTAIMQSIKGHTARKSNRELGRDGQFWQHESYDHWVRDGAELQRIVQYVVNNPVKARMVDHWQDWPWAYCKYPL